MHPMTLATGNKAPSAARTHRNGFSLIELLTVVAIMALVMGLIAIAITGMGRPGLQTAASQVASGMSLARQLAISKNTSAAFIIADKTGVNLPMQPFKYWTVAVSNRATTNWSIQKDWERLPEGVVFLQLKGNNYNTRNVNPYPPDSVIGTPYTPADFVNFRPYSGYFGNNTGATFNLSSMPAIVFQPNGSATTGAVAVRLADGTVDASNKVILRNTTRYMFVETDASVGRIRVRTPESYR